MTIHSIVRNNYWIRVSPWTKQVAAILLVAAHNASNKWHATVLILGLAIRICVDIIIPADLFDKPTVIFVSFVSG